MFSRRSFFLKIIGSLFTIPLSKVLPILVKPKALEVVPNNRLPKIMLPMIRKTFPELIASDIIDANPMNRPVENCFAFQYDYKESNIISTYTKQMRIEYEQWWKDNT